MVKKLLNIMVLIALLSFSIPGQASAAPVFSDINGHWAAQYITTLSSAGYINGYPDSSFKPDKTVSQAEFLSVLIACMGINPSDTQTKYFSDTASHWARGSINEAVKQGILIPSEYSNVLQPDSGLKRSQASAMMVRALGQQPDNNSVLPFTDNDTVETSMYRGYIKTAYDLDLLTGYPGGEFKPFEYITRAQMCTVILNFMEVNGSAPTTPVTPTTPTNQINGSFNAIAIGDELYDLVSTPVSIKVGFTNVTVHSLSVSQNTLSVNGSYTFALNTSLSGLDLIVHNKRYQVDKIMVNGNKLVVYPSGQKIANVTVGSLKYDADYVKVYFNSANSDYYLSDLLLLDSYNLQLNGRTYQLGKDRVTISAGNSYYDVYKVVMSPTANTLQLLETDAVIAKSLSISKISSIFVDNTTLNMATVDEISFIIDGQDYRLSEVTLDASGNFTLNNTIYGCEDVTMIVDGSQYQVNHIQLYKEKFIFYCNTVIESNWVIINDSYRDASEVKIMKDNIVYDMEQVMVVSKNLLRIGGRQYKLDSSFKIRYNNKIYDIDDIDFSVSKQAVIVDISESTGTWSSQPNKYVFYLNNTKYQEGTASGITLYANRQWVSFDNIVITDPSRFSYKGSNYNLIGALVKINNVEFIIVDTSWRGATQILDIYMTES